MERRSFLASISGGLAGFAQWFKPRRLRVDARALDPMALPSTGDSSAALQSSAVWACCRLVSEAVSALPGHIFEATLFGKVKATTHSYYRLLTTQPNPLMTWPQYIQTTVLHLMLYGNSFTLPEWLGGEVVALWPIPPDRVALVVNKDGSTTYRVTDAAGKPKDFKPLELIHYRLFSLDGIMGLSPIEYHRLSFDLDAYQRIYASNLYANSGRPAGVLEYPGNLSPEQITQIRSGWKSVHSGPSNAGGIVVLEGGTKYQALAIPPEQLEFIAQQRYATETIARIFGVPPHLIGAMDKPTYASVEQQSLEFVQYRIQPLVTMLERTLASALLEAPFFYKFNLAGFERSDIKTRYGAYAVGRQWGFLSVNDIRELEDLNNIGPAGDVYLQPLNMIEATGDAAAPGEEPNARTGIQSVPAA
jgi:HK97 family phage portal protein